MSKHTPGPWHVTEEREGASKAILVRCASSDILAEANETGYGIKRRRANARLIAAAPDHALVAAALASGLARWEPFNTGDDRGELCVRGLRYATSLDEFGVPVLASHTRAAIARARGQEVAP